MAAQNRTGLDWEDIRVFLALARHGTLSAAARAIGVNHTTIARRVAALEAALGEQLVERRPDRYVLTQAGTRILASASEMEVAAADLGRGGADGQPKGLVRINAPPSLAHAFLARRLAELVVRHSGLDIDLATDTRNVSLERREADIGLRFGRPYDGDVIARPLVSIGFGFYAAPAVRREIEAGGQPALVAFDEANADLPEAVWLSRAFPRARVAFRTSTGFAQAEAARAGAGVALLPHYIARCCPDLHPCPLACEPPARQLWLITRRVDHTNQTVRTVADHLVRIFKEQMARFEQAVASAPGA